MPLHAHLRFIVLKVFFNYRRFVYILVNGGYTPWSPFGPCNTTCVTGVTRVQVRHRNCTNPAPQHNGEDCSLLGNSEDTKSCDGCLGE